MATNGILVGLSRIAQYQSFVILGGLLALYFFRKAANHPRFEVSGIYFGFMSWAVAILAHYDALLIAPMVVYLLWEWLHSDRCRHTKTHEPPLGSKPLTGFASFLLSMQKRRTTGRLLAHGQVVVDLIIPTQPVYGLPI
jgi:hypothetical protein